MFINDYEDNFTLNGLSDNMDNTIFVIDKDKKIYGDNITYKYKITDYDNALLKSGGGYSLFYTIGEDKTEYEVNIDKLDDYASFALSNLKNEVQSTPHLHTV